MRPPPVEPTEPLPRRGSHIGRQRTAQTRRTRTRAKILSAYENLTSSGYFDVTIGQLASAARVSTRTIYEHAPKGISSVKEAHFQDLHINRNRTGQKSATASLVSLPKSSLGSIDSIKESLALLLRQGAQDDPGDERDACAQVDRLLDLARATGDRELHAYALYVRGRVVTTRTRADARGALAYFERAHQGFSDPESTTRHDLAEAAIACAQMLLFPQFATLDVEKGLQAADYLDEANAIFRETGTYHQFYVQDLVTARMLRLRLGESADINLDALFLDVAESLEAITRSAVYDQCAQRLAELSIVSAELGHCQSSTAAKILAKMEPRLFAPGALLALRTAYQVLSQPSPNPPAAAILLLLLEPSVPAALAIAALGGHQPDDFAPHLDAMATTLLWSRAVRNEVEQRVVARDSELAPVLARPLLEELIRGPILRGMYSSSDAQILSGLHRYLSKNPHGDVGNRRLDEGTSRVVGRRSGS